MKAWRILPFALLALVLTNCKKETVCTATNVTAEIDGSAFTSCTVTAFLSLSSIWVYADEDDKKDRWRRIRLVIPPATGTYTLGERPLHDTYAVTSVAGLPPDDYYTDSTHTGTLTISKLDTLNHLVSGSFSFIGNHYDKNMIKIVTAGSFTDVKWE